MRSASHQLFLSLAAATVVGTICFLAICVSAHPSDAPSLLGVVLDLVLVVYVFGALPAALASLVVGIMISAFLRELRRARFA